MKTPKPISPFRLASLLRQEKDPKLALCLFDNPTPNPNNNNLNNVALAKPKPFRYSLLCYDLILTKLGRAKIFDEMERILLQLRLETRLVPREALFCNIIGFYARARRPVDALKLFNEMPSYRCQRTIKSFNSLVNVLMVCKEIDMIKELLMGIDRHGKPDACTYNILIHGFSKSGRLDYARKLFDEMTEKGVRPNRGTFGTLIYGLCLGFRLEEALNLKEVMFQVHKVQPDEYVYVSLIKGLCRVGKLTLAFELKDEMVRNKVKLDTAIYSTLISGCVKAGRNEGIVEVLEEMKLHGCKPDAVTCNVMVQRFCKDKDFEAAYKVLDEMAGQGFKPDVIGYNIILGELCRDGKGSEAYELFQDMPRRGCAPDVVSYRIVFDGLSDGMQFKEAAFILDEMIFKGFLPCSGSIHKFLHMLCLEKKHELLCSALNSLGKGNALDVQAWKTAVAMVVEDDKLSCAIEPFGDWLPSECRV